MIRRGRVVETVFHWIAVLALTTNALAPTIPVAASSQSQDKPNLSPPKVVQPVQSSTTYQPPDIPRPSRTNPDPDQPASPIPPRSQIEFNVTSDQSVLDSNDRTTLKVTIRNNSGQEVDNLTFTDPLETGLQYVSSSSNALQYDAQKKHLTLSIPKLAPGQQITFNYMVGVAAAKRGDVTGKLWLHVAQLDSAQGNIHLKANTPFGRGLPVGNARSSFAALKTEGGWNSLGRFSIYMGKDAVDPDSALAASPNTVDIKGPPLQFKLDVVKAAKLNKDSQGNPVSQAVRLGQVSTAPFKSPAFLQVNLDGYANLNHIPAGQEPYVATYDEKNKVWIKVPILKRDPASNSVTVKASHFSTWGAGLGTSVPQNGANILLFDSHYTSLFTGTARYSIPIWTPPGRAGLSPDIALSYSSAKMDGVLGDVQAPWVGEGWNIDGVEIVRKITTSDTGYGYEDSYTLSINGMKYDLLVDPQNPSRYYTKIEQGDFLYIERHNEALGNVQDGQVFPQNTSGEWWEVVTKDGTRYRLGWNDDSEQLALMYGYSCTTGNPCTTPDGTYATLGYAGTAHDLVALRWRVDRVMDTHGNYMAYSYYEEHPSSSLVPQFDRASYLQSISYTGHVDGDQPGYEVSFVHGDRTGDAVPASFNMWDNYDTQQLNEIDICYGTCTPETIVRKYQFGYTVADVPDPNGTLTLDSLQISGGGFSEQGISIPLTQSPTIRFTYSNYDNRAVTGSDEKYPYPRLTKIENGYGGSLNYTYENDGRGADDWYDWRVKTVDVESGQDTAISKGYAYTTPVYAGSNNTGELIGYTDVTETTYDFDGTTKISDTSHHFGTVGLDIGFELSTSWKDASGTVLKKTDSAYVTDNAQAPFLGWNFRYLYQTTNYVVSGGSLAQASLTQYIRDPATGNLAEQDDYLGRSLYRKHYNEYWPNFNPDFYILDKPIRAVTVDPGNTIYADTRLGYDNKADLRSAPDPRIIKGDLTLVQKLTDATHTNDVTYHYDDKYGNRDDTCVYKNTGTPGIAPSGNCEETSVHYDDTLHTYAVKSTNALGQFSTTAYLYFLGLPYQVTDLNGWTTTTTYDGLGRSLSVTPPGLSQAGVTYAYPVPDGNGTVSAPYNVHIQIWDTQDGSSGTYRDVWGLYDGLGRTIQTQTEDADTSRLLVSDTDYNAQGLASQQSSPYYASGSGGSLITSGASQYTTTDYDALGRTVQVTAPGNIVTSTAYDGLVTTVTDPNGNKTASTADGAGRLVTSQEYDGGSVYATTHYTYDAAGRLIDTVDAQGNASSMTYDWLGRKLSMHDPDMGDWSYQYDGVGNLTQQTDARGQILTFGYDDLNRPTLKHDATSNVDLASYGYGTDGYGTANSEIGKRTSMTDQSGSTAWSYSNYGRTVTETKTIGSAANQASTTTSDWLGRVLSVSYPDSETLTYQYDALGRPKNFSSSAQTGDLADLAYNVLSQLTHVNLGNGVDVTNTYDSSTNRLSERATAKGGTGLIDFSYLYDQSGNITRINDQVLGETHAYQYDFLNRLTSAQATKGTDHPYQQTYQYDKVGNIQQVANWSSGDVIFKDDFEDSSLASWSSVVQDSQPLDIWTVDSSAVTPVSGQKSLLVEVNDNADAYVRDATLSGETGYRARFYFDPNHITMAAGDTLALFSGRTSSGSVVQVDLQLSNGVYQVRAGLQDNAASWTYGDWYTINNDQWSAVEIDWQSASQSGTVGLWVDGAFKQTVGPVDNGGQTLTEARLGAMNVSTGTRGQLLFDTFESRRLTYIGLLPSQLADKGQGHLVAFNSSTAPAGNGHLLIQNPDDILDPSQAIVPSPTPTFWSGADTYTSAMLHLDGADASTDIIDLTGKTWTAHGNAQIDTSQSVFGGASALFDGSGDYLSVPDSDGFDFGTGDFTIDFRVRFNAMPTTGHHRILFNQIADSYNKQYLSLFNYGGTYLWRYLVTDGGTDTIVLSFADPGVTTGVWYHIAFVRSGNNWYLFRDGVQQGTTATDGSAVPNIAAPVEIGRYPGTSLHDFSGWLDEYRISKGVARWTSDFTPPDVPYGSGPAPTAIPTITPSSTPTLTPTGTSVPSATPTITPTPTSTLTPFLPAHWPIDDDAGTPTGILDVGAGTPSNGTPSANVRFVPGFQVGALQFLASGGYVNIPRNVELEPAHGFTISAWVFPVQINQGTTYVILNKGGTAQDYRLYINADKYLVFRVNDLTPSEVIGPILPLFTWTHISAVYDPAAGLTKLYVNGDLMASKQVTGTISYNTSGALTLSDTTNPFIGIMDEVALYSGVLPETQIGELADLPLTATPHPTSTPTLIPTDTLVPSATDEPAPPPPVGVGTYDDTNSNWAYSSDWTPYTTTGPYNGTIHYTLSGTATAAISFQSASPVNFIFYYATNSNRGSFEIWVDGSKLTTINAYSATKVWQNTYTGPTYSDGAVHTVTIKSLSDGSQEVDIDAIQIAAPPPPPSPLPSGDLPWGTGNDGDLVVDSGATYNLNTQNQAGRSCADGGDAVAYSVVSLANTVATLSTSPSAGCLSPGDEILLINLQGTTSIAYNTGVYEFLRVATIDGSAVTFTTSKVNWYGEGFRSDDNLGTGTTKQRVMLMRVPNYQDVQINGILKANAWNGNKFGVVAFRVNGSLSGSGTISADGLGFRGGHGTAYTGFGEGVYGNVPSSGGGGSGQPHWESRCDLHPGGGGAYGTDGENGRASDGSNYYEYGYAGYTLGGTAYGEPTLSKLMFGAGGGTAYKDKNGNSCGIGQVGAGIVVVSGNTIDFGGSITAKGIDSGDYPGAGAGGAVRIQGNDISLNIVDASGGAGGSGKGGAGGQGRIAIYYQNNLDSTNVNPTAYTGLMGQQLSPTPSPTPTPVSFTPDPYGSGGDGDLVVDAGSTFNINTQHSGSRACADGIAYNVTSLADSQVTLSTYPESGCLAPGDEVLLINLMGSSSGYANVGNYEYLHVGDVNGNTVYFTSSKIKYYGANSDDDTNIGIGTGQQRVMLMRVPNYDNVTIDGTLTAKDWNDSAYGVIAFRTHGTLNGDGVISVDGLGFRGGSGSSENGFGEGIQGHVAGSGGGGTGQPVHQLACQYHPAGGGAYATNGGNARGKDGSGQDVLYWDGSLGWSYGGTAYGEPTLSKLLFGSGGGTGYHDRNGYGCGSGKPGGGIILLSGNNIDFAGTLTAKGIDSGDYPGAGAGGSVRIDGNDVSLNTVSVDGGARGAYKGGAGGRGRIAVYYQNTFTGNFTPYYLQKQDTPDNIFQDDFESGDLSQWSTSSTDNSDLAASVSSDYLGSYGLQAAINDNNNLYVEDDTPDNETEYRARFYVNPTGVTMASGDILDLFDGYNNGANVFQVQMQQVSGSYQVQVRAGILDNGTTWTYTNWSALANDWNAVEISYQALANDGAATLWVNGTSQGSLSQINNDTRTLTEVRLGAQGIQDGTRGTLYFDNFESRRFSYIGTLPTPDLPLAEPAAQPGWVGNDYTYDSNRPHAVAQVQQDDAGAAVTGQYTYDANGNMTCRMEEGAWFIQSYNALNRLSVVQKLASGDCADPGPLAAVWNFAYDGDGNRVTQAYTPYDGNGNPGAAVFTEYFMGGAYEVHTDSGGAVTDTIKYYAIAGMTVAMNDGSGLKYLLTDHLGSVIAVTDSNGSLVSQQRYMPFGEVRALGDPPRAITQTDFGFTGQRNLDAQGNESLGLMDYHARMYDAVLGRFIQPDSIIPGGGPQNLNRYSYVRNNPIRYNDPSGRFACTAASDCGNDITTQRNDYSSSIKSDFEWNLSGRWTLNDMKTVYDTGLDIKNYVDKQTSGKGLEWMKKYMGGGKLSRSPNSPVYLFLGNRGHALGNDVYLPTGWASGRFGDAHEYFAHELAHVWDTKSVGPSACMSLTKCGPQIQDFTSKFCWATICGGGNADLLTLALGGNPTGIRIWNGTSGIPEKNQWKAPGRTYGNQGTAEGFADSFMYMIYDPNRLIQATDVAGVLQGFIQAEASGLP